MTTPAPARPRRSRWWNRPRFDLVELTLIVVTVLVVVEVARHLLPDNFEGYELAQRYGPSRYSEGPEEWVIRDFFADRRDGFFVDIGANHYRERSKTYYLESRLGWRGIAVEPQKEFAADYAAHRPATKFLPFFVSDQSNAEAKMYVLANNRTVSSGDRAFVEKFGSNPSEVTVPTITLDDLLAAEQVTRIDFMNIDIELWEPKALAGFDLERHRPELVCIEALADVRQFILDYFARRGYTIVGRYLRSDDQNLYFTPIDRAR
jgi:FkbM family methyltransferase